MEDMKLLTTVNGRVLLAFYDNPSLSMKRLSI